MKGRSLVIVVYDISEGGNGSARSRAVAQACADYGIRVQKSVFECRLDPKDLVRLRARVTLAIDARTDSVRIYRTSPTGAMTSLGITGPVLPDAPLVV